MDDVQHSIQDSCEAYAVYVMQRTAENLGISTDGSSSARWADFVDYLNSCNMNLADFDKGDFAKYKNNVDLQVPRFVERLADYYGDSTFTFELVEAQARNGGLKTDVHIHVSGHREPVQLSIKNYIGSGGITRPQVSSGTYLSFANGFIFERIGVGKYEDPRPDMKWFMGSNGATREAVLDYTKRSEYKKWLAHLSELSREMREDLLGDDCRMYDQSRVRAAVDRCANAGIATVLAIFHALGPETVQEKFLARMGMDGTEEALFFDARQYIDSITSPKYHQLRAKLNASSTTFRYDQHGQGIRFEFIDTSGKSLLSTDVPFTINTNGAWHRPKKRYEGRQIKNDKGTEVRLLWGERRPNKSREIATSTNTWVNLRKAGIFSE